MKNTSTLVKKVLKNNEINTVILDRIEGDVPALTSRNPDGSYTIVLNNQYSKERLEQEYIHELKHIQEDHFSLQTADEAEKLVRTEQDVYVRLSVIYRFYDAFERKMQLESIKEINEIIRSLMPEKDPSILYEDDYYPAGARREMIRRGWL